MPESHKIKITDPPKSVAGLKAIGKAISQVSGTLSTAKAIRVFKKLNQKQGVDCPGCAWPDPEKRSKLGEFCENGIKAIVEEAMDAKADEAIFYTSGRTSNEAAFLYQLFVRLFGTNNLPDCSNMCHESSGVALSETLGIGKGSVKLEDIYLAEVILIFGQNPATNHPRMLTALEKAKKNGAKIVVINPLKEVGLLKFKNPQTTKGLLGDGSELADSEI